MSASGFTPISLYYSTTASAVPTAANLVPGELAINTNDGKLYYEDSSGVVQVLATKSTGSIGGSNTQVQFNNSGSLGGSSGLTWDGSFLTTNSIKNSALTSGRVTFAGTAGLLQDSGNLTWNGTTLAITGGESLTGVLNLSGVNQMHQLSGHNFVQGDANTTYLYGGANGGQIRTANNGSILWDWSDAGLFNWYASGGIKMTLLASGNLGIGTSSPGAKLQVNGSGGGQLFIDNAGTGDNYYDAGNHYFRASSGSSTKMVLDVNGQLGIGTSSPAAFLNVSGALGSSAYSEIARFTNTSVNAGPKLTFYGVQGVQTPALLSGSIGFNQTFNQNNNGQPAFIIEVGNSGSISEKVRVTYDGNLLVGTSSNTTNGGFIFSTDFYGAGRSTQIIGHINGASSGDAYMVFNYNGTGIGSITQTGTTGVLYNVTSDQRLKTNVVNAPSGNIDGIKVRSFDWIADGSHQEYGMVAQELIEVAPYAVNKPDNSDEMMGVDYSKLVPMMIKEIQDLKQRIATLENK